MRRQRAPGWRSLPIEIVPATVSRIDDASTSESLTDSLIDSNRRDVAQFNGAALMVQDATFNENPLIGDVHLVRAPTPRSRQRDQRERPRKQHGQQSLVLVHDMHVLGAQDDQGDERDGHYDTGRLMPRDTGVTEMIRTSPSRRIVRVAIPTSVRTQRRKFQNIRRETPVNLTIHTLRIWWAAISK
jgi:hypothetical protein